MDDPCVKLCTDLGAAYGVEVIKFASMVAGFVFLWWRNRKTAVVAADSKAAAVTANEQARAAKAELREAKLSLARIEGSLRPAAVVQDTKIITDDSAPDLTLHGDVKFPADAPVPKFQPK